MVSSPKTAQKNFFEDDDNIPRVINLNEPRVIAVVQNLIDTEQLACDCQECILDIAALALNSTPTRYIVNEFHMNCFGDARPEPSDEELSAIVWEAAQRVAQRPHHKPHER